jgi:protein LSM14
MSKNLIGKRISLTSNNNCRYEGTLDSVDAAQQLVKLINVQTRGTENREPSSNFVPGSDDIYQYIIFRGSDIKELSLIQESAVPEKVSPPVQAPTRPNVVDDDFDAQRPRPQAPHTPARSVLNSYDKKPLHQSPAPNRPTPSQDNRNQQQHSNQSSRNHPNYNPSYNRDNKTGNGGNNPSYNRDNRDNRHNRDNRDNRENTSYGRNNPSSYQKPQSNQNVTHTRPTNVNDPWNTRANPHNQNTQSNARGGGNPRGRGRHNPQFMPRTQGEPVKPIELEELNEASLAFDKQSLFAEFQAEQQPEIQEQNGNEEDDFFDKMTLSESKDGGKRKDTLAEQHKVNQETFGPMTFNQSVHGGSRNRGYRGGHHNRGQRRNPTGNTGYSGRGKSTTPQFSKEQVEANWTAESV